MTPFVSALVLLAACAAGSRIRVQLDEGHTVAGRYRLVKLLRSDTREEPDDEQPSRQVGQFPWGNGEGSPLSKEEFAAPTELGRGAFGDTWQAVDLEKDTPVAVKIFFTNNKYVTKEALSKDNKLEEAVEENHGECKLVQDMLANNADHEGKDHICNCIASHAKDQKVEDDVSFLVLELCGTDLDKRLRQQMAEPVAADEWLAHVRKWMVGSLQGISFLSSLSPPKMHMDIKLNNIVATDQDEAKLIDFGFTSDYDKFSNVKVTPRFAPPEHFVAVMSGKTVKYTPEKAWAYDVWTLGQVYYNLLCSTPSGDAMNAAMAVLEEEDLSKFNNQCPDGGKGFGKDEDWAVVSGALSPIDKRPSPAELIAKLPKLEKPPACADVKERKTGGTCRIFKCNKSRNAKCTKEYKNKWRCICQPGFCAVDGKCVKG